MRRIDHLILPMGNSTPELKLNEMSDLISPCEGILIGNNSSKLIVYNVITQMEVAAHDLPHDMHSHFVLAVDETTLLIIGNKKTFATFQYRNRVVCVIMKSHDGFLTCQMRERFLMPWSRHMLFIIDVLQLQNDIVIAIHEHIRKSSVYVVPIDEILNCDDNSQEKSITKRSAEFTRTDTLLPFDDNKIICIRAKDRRMEIVDIMTGSSREVAIWFDDGVTLDHLELMLFQRLPTDWCDGDKIALGYAENAPKFHLDLDTGELKMVPSFATSCCKKFKRVSNIKARPSMINDTDSLTDFAFIEGDMTFVGDDCYVVQSQNLGVCSCWPMAHQPHYLLRLPKTGIPSLAQLTAKIVMSRLSIDIRKSISLEDSPRSYIELARGICKRVELC